MTINLSKMNECINCRNSYSECAFHTEWKICWIKQLDEMKNVMMSVETLNDIGWYYYYIEYRCTILYENYILK